VRFFALIIAIGMSASGCGAIAPIKGSGRQPRTNVVGIHLGGHPLQTVVGAGSVWVLICDAGCSQRTLPQRARLAEGRLMRLSVETGRVLSVTPIADPGAVAVGEGAAWVTHPDKGTVSRIDLDRGRVVATVGLVLPRPIVPGNRAFLPNDVAAGERGVWVSTARGWVARIDPGLTG
jgi:hypothetical protein